MSYLPSFLPGMSFKKRAESWKAHYMAMAQEGLQKVKDKVVCAVLVLLGEIASGRSRQEELRVHQCYPEL